MVKFINRLTGTEMWVADTLLDKHISGGIQNPNADPLALGSHTSGTKLALKAR